MLTKRMIFSGNPILGSFFTFAAWKVLLCTSLAACIFLLFPSWLLGIASIPTAKGNEGFLYSYHWSVMYTLIVPSLLAAAGVISQKMRDCVCELCNKKRITPISDENREEYSQALSIFLQNKARKLLVISIFVTVFVIAADTHDLWSSFVTGNVPVSRNPDWDTSFNVKNWESDYDSPEFLTYKADPPSRVANLLFDLFAYSFQGLAFFLAFFWIGKFALYLLAFSILIGGKEAEYRFNPLTKDLDNRMGLKPMGALFDYFLQITLAIEVYAFYHRLFLIDGARNQPFPTYFVNTFLRILKPATDNPAPFPINHLTEVFTYPSWGFDALDASTCITILFMTIPIAVVCFLPLWKIRRLVKNIREAELQRIQQDYENAFRRRSSSQVIIAEREKELLEKTNIWPNGDAKAKFYLTLISCFAAGAVSPPLLALVIVVNLSTELTKFSKFILQK